MAGSIAAAPLMSNFVFSLYYSNQSAIAIAAKGRKIISRMLLMGYFTGKATIFYYCFFTITAKETFCADY
jgi:hypothetical protein